MRLIERDDVMIRLEAYEKISSDASLRMAAEDNKQYYVALQMRDVKDIIDETTGRPYVVNMTEETQQ